MLFKFKPTNPYLRRGDGRFKHAFVPFHQMCRIGKNRKTKEMAQRAKINMEMEKKGMPWAGFCLCLFCTIYFQLYAMQY